MKMIFWKDGDYEGVGGIYIRNDLKDFFKTLTDKGLNPMGIEVDSESMNMQIIVENNEAYKNLYPDNQH
jgi:hypothetical protein